MLINVDTSVHPELINSRFVYVAVSRGSDDARLFTNDAASLVPTLSHDASKTSAVEIGKAHNLPHGMEQDTGKQQANHSENVLSL